MKARTTQEDLKGLTKRMFQDEDEEDAELQREERFEKLIKADENMKKIKADKDEKVRKQTEAKIKEEHERKEKDEEQKNKSVNGWKTNIEKQSRDRKNKKLTGLRKSNFKSSKRLNFS